MKHDIIYKNVEKNYKYYSQRWGYENEKTIKFIYNLDEVYVDNILPCKVFNMGITYPNSHYKIVRAKSRIFIIEHVISGKGYLLVNGKKFTLEAGDTYILEQGSSHTYYADEKNPFKKIWINFYSYCYGDFLKSLNMNDIYYFKKINIEPFFTKLFLLEKVSPFMDDIAFQAYDIVLSLTLYIKECLCKKERSDIPEFIKQIKNKIDENYKITIESICKDFNFSRPTIIKLFKKYYDITPNQYRIKNIMNAACIYLINSDKSIVEISLLLGYPDAYSFSHAFKKSIGVSPSQYRLNNCNPPIDY